MSEPPPARTNEFEALVKPHLDYLYGMAVRLSGNRAAAEDVVQDALLKAFQGFPALRDRGRFRVWVTRILTNCHHDRGRAERGAGATVSLDDEANFDLYDKIVEEDPFPYSDRVHLDFVALFDDTRIIEVLKGIHPEYRTALILAYVYGYSVLDVSEITGAPVGTVLARLHRARKQLERRLWDHAVRHNLIPHSEVRA